MRISDWSSDVCSSDLSGRDPEDEGPGGEVRRPARKRASAGAVPVGGVPRPVPLQRLPPGRHRPDRARRRPGDRSEEHTSELQSLMRISYAVFCLKTKKQTIRNIEIITKIKTD